MRRGSMRFYTIKLPKFLGGMIRGIIEAFNKKK
ncbi:stage V sporulation protein SpoVM [Brevibacillus gelatini]|nr:stage V sporulation protein SpoVM [Brevibacillus gelatini]